MATGLIVVLGMLWIPIMDKIGGGVLYQYLQNVQAYIAPPITAVFVLGILWKRINAQGAIATLFYGLISATLRIILELMKDDLSVVADAIREQNAQSTRISPASLRISARSSSGKRAMIAA